MVLTGKYTVEFLHKIPTSYIPLALEPLSPFLLQYYYLPHTCPVLSPHLNHFKVELFWKNKIS